MKNFILLLVFATTYCVNTSAQLIHHEIKVTINIDTKSIEAVDSVKIPGAFLNSIKDTLNFYLNADFTVKSLNAAYAIKEIKETNTDTSATIKSKRYMINYSAANKKGFTIPLQYSGKVEGEIKTGAVEYARGFSETAGMICKDGIYMAGSTIWVPAFDDTMFTFNLTAAIDKEWGIVSQGTRTKNDVVQDKKIIRYESPDPADEVYLIAAKWTEYNKKAGNILVQAVLRTPDSTMANKYLNATIDYLMLYEKLVGQYPYTKFTLVENFWPTGYGMPSFTLLGSTIIRFPFILTSSYPHELLHNYWGNSVFVNNDKGNWCEGLTAYMADHLIKEQQGQGAEYRRNTLQKFTDFVNESNDFPITKFRSRNNSAEEAIGYGKVSMLFDMLRYQFGNDVFRKAIAKFYKDNKFRYASFTDIQKSFEEVTGEKLNKFFDQWLFRTGAPTLKLSNVTVTPKDNQFELSFTLLQLQKEDPFRLKVPVIIYVEGEDSVTVKDIQFSKRTETYTFTFTKRPARIDIDPQFNVFRRLDREEVPYSLSQIFGNKDATLILPKNSPSLKEYSDLAEQWKQTQNVQGNKLEIKFDADLQELPAQATWIIGFENKFAATLNVFADYTGYLSKETFDQTETLKKSGALVYVFPNSKNKMLTNGFLGSNNPTMIAALKNKITHYSKYSYLGFEGDKAENKLKGEFPTVSSPLSFYIKYDGKALQTTAKLKPRKALMY
ncbi:MAG: M1 family aminopeptidase [Bacteroidota bacterium]